MTEAVWALRTDVPLQMDLDVEDVPVRTVSVVLTVSAVTMHGTTSV